MRRKTLRLLRLFIFVTAFSRTVYAQTSKFMSVDEVRPGMKGIARTVFQGTKIDEFEVELLGVLKNFAPKQDMILARLSGGPLSHTGVIAGMSGSPVYVDGKLLGAVAFSFPFSTEPIAGIQPIQQMLSLLDQKGSPGTPLYQLMLPQSLLASSPFGTVASPASMTRIQTPLFVSGASEAALTQFAAFFSAFGFAPVQGGGSGSAAASAAGPANIEPGSMFAGPAA